MKGKTLSFVVEPKETIYELMKKVETKEGISTSSQRLIFAGKQLCPAANISAYHIQRESTLHCVLSKKESGAIPADTLINNIYVESINWMNLHDILQAFIDTTWDTKATKIIYDYASFINLNVTQWKMLCPGMQAGTHPNKCNGTFHSTFYKPLINATLFQKHFVENVNVSFDNCNNIDKTAQFYGLFLRFEFIPYTTDYNTEWKMETAVNYISDKNIHEYIEIIEFTSKIPIKFRLYNTDKTDNKQYITLQIDEHALKRKQMQQLFTDSKCMVTMVSIKERDLPCIYLGGICDKGKKIGDVGLMHYIFLINSFHIMKQKAIKPKPSMTLFVKNVTGKTATLHVSKNETIYGIMIKYQKAEGFIPEQQRYIFNGKQLCPAANLSDYGIGKNATINFVPRSDESVKPPDTLMKNIYVETIHCMDLHQIIQECDIVKLINNDAVVCIWNLYLTKMVYNYALFVDLNVTKWTLLCASNKSESHPKRCYGSFASTQHKPSIDSHKIEQYFDQHVVTCKIPHFYGLWLRFEFAQYIATGTVEIDVDCMTNASIKQYIEIKEFATKTPIKYRLYDIEKIDNKQFITLEIDAEYLKTKEIQQLFGNEKYIAMSILFTEKETLIYRGKRDDKPLNIGSISLKHYVFYG